METTVDCKQIEQCIKGLLFKNKVTDPPLQNDPNFKTHSYKFSVDDKYLVSNIEEKTQLGVKPTDSTFCNIPSKTEKLNNETGVSELIDLNVLTNFAAEHLENTHFSSSDLVLNSNSTRLPHPEHEDNDTPNDIEKKPVISVLLDNISKEIQNSPNFLSMPENPLPETSLSSQNYAISNGFDQSFCKQNDVRNKKARSKRRRGQKHNAKEKTFHEVMPEASRIVGQKPVNPLKPGLLNDSSFKTRLEVSSKEKTVLNSDDKKSIPSTYDQIPDIKIKRNNLTSTGKEYSFSVIQGNYKFQCHLCNHTCDGKSNVIKHLQSKSHRIHKEQNDLDMMLPYLPLPLPEQIEAINDLLLNDISQFGLRDTDLIIRKNVIDRVTKFVEEHVQSCSVEAIGSSATGFGLQTSAVDFTLKLPPDDSVPDALENVFKAIHSDDSFDNVKNDFKKKRPSIHFIDKETCLTCNIEIDNGFSVKLANLLALYHDLDERVPILGTAVRFWASLCEIDQQDSGTLPSFAFEILLIHFLQQVNPPVLPVLHEVKGYTNTVEFYKEYKEKKEWVSKNSSSVGELWINFFKFYNFSYKIGEDVVSIRSLKRVSCSDKNWSTKFYAIEDPFLKRNLAYVIPTYQVCHYIHDCFLRTYRYFAYPRLKDGCIKLIKADWCNAALLSSFSAEKPLMKEDSTESDMSENEDQLDVSQDLEDHDQDIPFDDVIATVSKLTLDESDMEKLEGDSEFLPSVPSTDLITKEESEAFSKESKANEKAIDQTVMCFWDLPEEKFSKESFDYIFKAQYFKGIKSVPLVCRMCKCQGHQKKDCPNDQLPTPCTLPEMTSEFLKSVTKALFYIRDKHVVTDTDMKDMTSDMEEIQRYIREVFPDATLSLFGSFCNGFGFKTKSDMDCCLTFGAREDSKDLDCIDIIEKVAKQLRAHPKLENIIPVTSAKVPIVKFTYIHSGLEGDISLYNTLALVNTEMLETYSKIDERVQILGFALKYFAKTLGICDASRGSLSSYAYILMVIYFLQQRNPPVIPVLQELYNGEKPSKLIEGWNVWFFKDIDKLADVWPDYGKNKETVAELWLGLLSFYACDFDWREYVVSIRQKNLLTRFRKLWLSDQIAIEDPFDLNHNLGAGLSRKMNSYILKAFIRGRERFGTPLSVERMSSILGYEVGYLFDRRFLNSGCEPPHDRGCRNCGKIGHIAKNCSLQKRCSQCNSSEHLYKNCPKRRKGRRSKGPVQNDFHENSSRQMTNENQNSLVGQQKRKKVETAAKSVTSTSHGHWNSNETDIQRKMISSGMPVHRLPVPPPGFTSRSYNPPPGFKATINMHQNSYPEPFVPHLQMRSPFSRQEISPPKQYSVSPPKNFPGAKPFPHASMNMQPGAQIGRHPAAADQRHMQTLWRTKGCQIRDSFTHQGSQIRDSFTHQGSQMRDSFTHQQPNQPQMVEHRPRTRSSILPFGPNYLGDKRQC